jgi:hypothetical protein
MKKTCRRTCAVRTLAAVGLASLWASCVSTVPIDDTELASITSQIVPMEPARAVALLQTMSTRMLRQYGIDDEEVYVMTNDFTSAGMTRSTYYDEPTTDPLVGAIVLAHDYRRSVLVFPWKEASRLTVWRGLDIVERPFVGINMEFRHGRGRIESLSRGSYRTVSDESLQNVTLCIAWVSDSEALQADEIQRSILPHWTLLPILSAIHSLTGLTPETLPPGSE